MQLLAQSSKPFGSIGGSGLGPFGNSAYGGGAGGGTVALTQITNVVSSVLGLITVGASVWCLFQLLRGGLNWISSGGDAKKLEDAQKRITNAIMGIIIVAASWAILALTGQFIGYDILINPGAVINSLGL